MLPTLDQLGSFTEASGTRPVFGPSRHDPLALLADRGYQRSLTPIANYLGCLGSYSGPVDHEHSEPGTLASAHEALRDARIFDLGMSLCDFHALAYELIANLYGVQMPDVSTNASFQHPKRDSEKLRSFVDALFNLPASMLPSPPTKRPFESMFLHWAGPKYTRIGSGLRVSIGGTITGKDFLKGDAVGSPMGLLISPERIVEYMLVHKPDELDTMLTVHVLHWTSSEGWRKPQTAMPWIVACIVAYLNGHNTLVRGKLDKRAQHDVMKMSKKFVGGPVRPRDYYTLVMHRQTLDESVLKLRQQLHKRVHKYRVDVRGHESCRVLRGRLPLSDKDEKKLRERGYRLYINTELSAEDAERMAHRDMPVRRPDEWIAVLSWWRDNFMSPSNEDLPYVPAVRKPTEPVTR